MDLFYGNHNLPYLLVVLAWLMITLHEKTVVRNYKQSMSEWMDVSRFERILHWRALACLSGIDFLLFLQPHLLLLCNHGLFGVIIDAIISSSPSNQHHYYHHGLSVQHWLLTRPPISPSPTIPILCNHRLFHVIIGQGTLSSTRAFVLAMDVKSWRALRECFF